MSAEYDIIITAKGEETKANTKKRNPEECQLLRVSCQFNDRPRRGLLLRLLAPVKPFAYVVANYRRQYRHKKGEEIVHANTSFLPERVAARIL